MRIELNIGLEVANGDNTIHSRSRRAVLAMRALAGWATYDRLAQSSTEETLIMVCHVTPEDLGDFNAAVYELAVAIEQDCIAVYNATRLSGELIGPNALAWGRSTRSSSSATMSPMARPRSTPRSPRQSLSPTRATAPRRAACRATVSGPTTHT